MNPLFQTLIDCGHEMEAALREMDVDRFEALVSARAEIIESLRRAGPPSALDPEWREIADALERQERLIMVQVNRCQDALAEALRSSAQMQQASKSYVADGGSRRILHHKLTA